MRIPRLLTILGPAAVFYVLASRASRAASESLRSSPSIESVIAVFSIALSLTPLLLLAAPKMRGTSRLAWMGTLLAVAVATTGVPSATPLALAHGIAWLSAVAIMLDLALPRPLTPTARHTTLGLFVAAALVGAALADAQLLPDATLGAIVVLGIIATGALHQVLLVGRGHTLEGALSGIALASLGVALAYAWFGPFVGLPGICLEFAAAVLLWLGHLAWIDPHWRSLRRVGIPFLAACVASFFVGLFLASRLPEAPWQLGAVFMGIGALWWATFAAAKRFGSRAVWSTSGRLTESVETAQYNIVAGGTLDEIAGDALAPLAEVFKEADGRVELFTLQPPLRIRLDASKRPNMRSADAPPAMVHAVFGGGESTVLDIVHLRSRVVREPTIRDLVSIMDNDGTGAVLPCVHLDHVEALLVLPIGDRTEPLSRVELDAMARFGESLGRALSSALTQRRADSHIQELSVLRRDAEDRAETLEVELEQLRGHFDVLGRGLAEDQTIHVAYSASMRRVQTRAISLAPTGEPVFLIAAAGAPVLPISRFIHDGGPRWEAPFVVADCSSATPDRVMSLLFGSEEKRRKGWLQSATGGTLLLRDLPALPASAQARLATAFLNQGGDAEDVRLIVTARRSMKELEARGALDPGLAQLFTGSDLTIPSLRRRREDVPSLVLLAIDRACRVLASEPVGIEQKAMSALVAHDWPGDVAELEFVVELAVSRVSGTTIRFGDLPPLAWPAEDNGDPLCGTYAEVERRLLRRALVHAGGNKSEAARILGLKRTTFLDKLRRHDLEKQPPDSMGGSAVG